ncbi:MAG: helix-turn-helix transcriptional regulator [Thiopseudomonas sp.]|nr:helix-turn-helix transcriptional regulator [Thiopseudomonas sp.]MCK9464887.1 helix-turn-helix transcriptional regulator [Thiopseudomonas sp.]
MLSQWVLMLQQHRLQKNLTQAELARRVGISVPTVSNLENGKNTSLETFIAVVFALGLQQELQELFSKKTMTIAELEQLYAKPKRQRASNRVASAKTGSQGGQPTASDSNQTSSQQRAKLWDKKLFSSADTGDKS